VYCLATKRTEKRNEENANVSFLETQTTTRGLVYTGSADHTAACSTIPNS